MGAKVALLGTVRFGVDIDSIVGTGGDAGLAADALASMEVDDAIRTPVHCRGGTDGYAWGSIALIAPIDLKVAPYLGKDTYLHLFHIGTGYADGNIVLLFASDGTSMTSDASVMVDYLAPFGWGVGLLVRF